MSFTPWNTFLDKYYASPGKLGIRSVIYPIFHGYRRSRWAAKLHFGTKVLPIKLELNAKVYFAVGTLLMKNVIKEKLLQSPDLTVLEMGLGAFAIPSGYLSRISTKTIDACDVDLMCVEYSQAHVKLNDFKVNVFYSDFFSNVPSDKKYDLIYWSLPYDTYDANKIETYLTGLFQAVPDYLSDSGQVVIINNTKTVPQAVVLNVLSKYGQLGLVEIKTWWWSPHNVYVIKKISSPHI